MCYIEDKERLGEKYYASGCIETHVCIFIKQLMKIH
jgi:hypothetical protein